MLITFSGMVGSGKTTAARYAMASLTSAGIPSAYLCFQSLPCFAWLGRSFYLRLLTRRRAPEQAAEQAREDRRRVGYRQRPLTLGLTAGYASRIVAFRLFRWFAPPHVCHISNRYFYDSLVHYQLAGRAERLYFALLTRLIPMPDVAVVLVASPETIAARRPNYAAEYVTTVWEAYRLLLERIPGLVAIRSDVPEQQAALESVLRRALSGDSPLSHPSA